MDNKLGMLSRSVPGLVQVLNHLQKRYAIRAPGPVYDQFQCRYGFRISSKIEMEPKSVVGPIECQDHFQALCSFKTNSKCWNQIQFQIGMCKRSWN